MIITWESVLFTVSLSGGKYREIGDCSIDSDPTDLGSSIFPYITKLVLPQCFAHLGIFVL